MTEYLLKKLIKDGFITQREVAKHMQLNQSDINFFLNFGRCPRWLPRLQFNQRIKSYLVDKCGFDAKKVDDGLAQLECLNERYTELKSGLKSTD